MADENDTQTTSTSTSDHSSSVDSITNQSQVPGIDGVKSTNGNIPKFPIMYPGMVLGVFPPQKDQEQMNGGPGLYAVAVHSCMQPFNGYPPNTLIPFTYNVPTTHSSPETRDLGSGQGQVRQQPQQQQQAGPQRQFVGRRFQIAIQLDLFLILKLAAVIFLFNQDGSRQRLTLLVFFASIVYLYQTGALAPVIRWLSQGMQRAAQPPRAAVRVDNTPAAEVPGNENEGQPAGENENQQVNDRDGAIENVAAGDPAQGEVVNRWRVIVKEIQLIVFGFITSLLPGFHNID